MAIPSLAMIPSGYKDGKVYSVLPSNGDGDFTFSRGSNATRVNKDGLIETMPLELGSELVNNGSFTGSATGWNLGAGWVYGSNVLEATSTSSVCYQDIAAIQSGKTYTVTYEISNYSGGNIQWRFGGSGTIDGVTRNADGTYTESFINNSSGDKRLFLSPSGFTGSIDNVSVKEITSGLDLPRLDYSDSSCPSLLLEPQSTNLVTYSESMNQYTAVNGTITPNALTSPDGTLNAVKFFENSNNSQHVFDTNSISVTSGTKYTISVFAKYSGRFLTLQGSTHLGSAFATFNLQNGTLEQQGVGTASIEQMSNDWYRCKLVVQMVSSGNGVASALLNDSATGGRSRGYQGDGSSGVYLYGFQIEEGSYPTSYIPTNGATATRLADVCNDAGTSDTFNDSEGVLMMEISALADDETNRQITISDTSNTNRLVLKYDNQSNVIQSFNRVGGSETAFLSATISDITLFNKCLIKYKANDYQLWINGFKLDTDISSTVWPESTLSDLKFSEGGGSDLYGKTKQIQYYNSSLTDSELEELTSWESFLDMANGQNYTIK